MQIGHGLAGEKFAIDQMHVARVGGLEFQSREHVLVAIPDRPVTQMLGHHVLGLDGQGLQVDEAGFPLAQRQPVESSNPFVQLGVMALVFFLATLYYKRKHSV